jgi:hypothetical protein
MNSNLLAEQDTDNKTMLRNLNIFGLGYFIYFISYTLTGTGYVNFVLFQGFQVIGLALIVPSAINLIKFQIENSYLKFIFILYVTWSLFVIIKGYDFLFDYNFLKRFLTDPTYGGMLYFVPLILLFPKQGIFYKRVFDLIVLFGITYIIYDIVFLRDLLSSQNENQTSLGVMELSSDLSFACAFILLTHVYHSNKRVLLAAIAMLLTFLFAIIRARRGLILMTSSILLFSYLFYLFNSKRKLLISYLSVLMILIGIVYTIHLYKPAENRIFAYVMERGNDDTRTGVELYFYADMKIKDWITGRGINGEYFCPDIEEQQVTNYRNVIETGYLQVILKGGLISLGLLLLIALPAFIKGLFFSKNIFSKAAAIWIFWVLISMYPAVVNSFTLRYLLFWIAIGICYSENIRNMSDNSVKQFIYSY